MIKNECTNVQIGVVGIGLMGCSITTCLLMAGHRVIALAPLPVDLETAEYRILGHLQRSFDEGLTAKHPDIYHKKLVITQDYSLLAGCAIVMECTIENIDIKKEVYRRIEQEIDADAIITSNTSAIPISLLQQELHHPERLLGLHWAEPSHTTRFLEIICGNKSSMDRAEYLYEMAHLWGKEPTLVKKEIRGFITNRLMYAMYREAFYLVENGYASIEDIDRACRNNPGYWMTLVGIFRWMDLTGIAAYQTVMQDLFPTLNNQTTVPALINDVVKNGGKGVINAKGFYKYTEEEAVLWEETFKDFSYEIRQLAAKYPIDVVKTKMAAKVDSDSTASQS
jgi:3-hydroxybutyryl-CoA dehydrogenase